MSQIRNTSKYLFKTPVYIKYERLLAKQINCSPLNKLGKYRRPIINKFACLHALHCPNFCWISQKASRIDRQINMDGWIEEQLERYMLDIERGV